MDYTVYYSHQDKLKERAVKIKLIEIVLKLNDAY